MTLEIPFAEVHDPAVTEQWRAYERSKLAEVITQYNLCNALFGLSRSGMADRLDVADGSAIRDVIGPLDERLGTHLLRYLAVLGIVEIDGDRVRPTERGRGLLGEIGRAQLGFYREAYGPVTQRLDELLLGEAEYGTDVIRNGEALGRNSGRLFHIFHTPVVLAALNDMQATHVLDLGCGAGRSLIDAALRDPTFEGVGLDISSDAIEYAQQLAEKEGISDRLRFVVGDAFRPETWPNECRGVDAIMAVGVMHEHFRNGEEAVIELLNRFADLLRGGVKGLLIGEPELKYDAVANDPDFYLAHIFTNQGFPMALDGWIELFPKTQLRCRRIRRRSDCGPRLVFYELEARPKGIGPAR